jgi:hypothetical protein
MRRWDGIRSAILVKLERQVLNSVGQILRHPDIGDDCQILDSAANRHAELVRVDNACERLPFALPCRGDLQEVSISREKDLV